MKISEIFTSIQGEGPNMGRPTTFIRFFGCNMRCEWCDTAYAVTSQAAKKAGKNPAEMNRTEILKVVKGKGLKHICLTGGEPTVQKDFRALVFELLDEGHSIDVFTNGTKDIWPLLDYVNTRKLFFVIDLKLPSSGVSYTAEQWQTFTSNVFTRNSHLKCVLTSRDDLRHVLILLDKLRKDGHATSDVQILSIDLTPAFNNHPLAREVADMIIKMKGNDLLLLPQLHKVWVMR